MLWLESSIRVQSQTPLSKTLMWFSKFHFVFFKKRIMIENSQHGYDFPDLELEWAYKINTKTNLLLKFNNHE